VTLANRYRPKKFTDVVGQEKEVELLRRILEHGWKPNALMITGPFGTGKTTLSRLIARAFLCENRQGVEPCGTCPSCVAIDQEANLNYVEVDAASQGLVNDVRAMIDQVNYRISGKGMHIICYDESHMLSAAAQNALLHILEEGREGVMFIFATTEAQQMMPTVRSRCVILNVSLLTPGQIAGRLVEVAKLENFDLEERAAKVIGTYVRGHVRDAMVLLEQLHQMFGKVTESTVRDYLRLDRMDLVYNLLLIKEKAEAVAKLEELLCTFAPAELAELVGEVLTNAYRLSLGLNSFTQVDAAWLAKVGEERKGKLLDQAEKVLRLELAYPNIHYATAAFSRILFEDTGQVQTVRPALAVAGGAPTPVAINPMRKPKP
jgi:DNA polymerase-3 subunit gamma/tau